jgi:D-alanyl-D-alanine endopeptidase (penicillin-binding protein 7)
MQSKEAGRFRSGGRRALMTLALSGLLTFGLAPAAMAETASVAAAQKVSTTSASKPASTQKKSSTSVKKKTTKKKTSTKSSAKKKKSTNHKAVAIKAKPSMGQALGLHSTRDALNLKSSVALVADQETQEVLFGKNVEAVLPIASITKLMTALVVLDAQQPMDEILTITSADIDTEKGSHSRLAVGLEFSREDLMLLALMSSENRAASALGRNYPGGRAAFIAAMNRKARALGMNDSFFVDSTGLSSRNVSSAVDLVRLVNASYQSPVIRRFSTQTSHTVHAGKRVMEFVSSNRLVRYRDDWDIGLQKTGYISEAGRCLVMQAKVHGRPVVMVFLDSVGTLTRFADAQRVRNWLEAQPKSSIASHGGGLIQTSAQNSSM